MDEADGDWRWEGRIGRNAQDRKRAEQKGRDGQKGLEEQDYGADEIVEASCLIWRVANSSEGLRTHLRDYELIWGIAKRTTP